MSYMTEIKLKILVEFYLISNLWKANYLTCFVSCFCFSFGVVNKPN